MTKTQPKIAQNQNPSECRFLVVIAPPIAVAKGKSPVTTAACIEGTSRKAIAIPKGNPITVPAALSPNVRHKARGGTEHRRTKRYAALNNPATAARPAVTKNGLNCGCWLSPTASLVMGKVSAKMNTPKAPST